MIGHLKIFAAEVLILGQASKLNNSYSASLTAKALRSLWNLGSSVDYIYIYVYMYESG